MRYAAFLSRANNQNQNSESRIKRRHMGPTCRRLERRWKIQNNAIRFASDAWVSLRIDAAASLCGQRAAIVCARPQVIITRFAERQQATNHFRVQEHTRTPRSEDAGRRSDPYYHFARRAGREPPSSRSAAPCLLMTPARGIVVGSSGTRWNRCAGRANSYGVSVACCAWAPHMTGRTFRFLRLGAITQESLLLLRGYNSFAVIAILFSFNLLF